MMRPRAGRFLGAAAALLVGVLSSSPVATVASADVPMAAPASTAGAVTGVLASRVVGRSIDGRAIIAYELGDRTAGYTAVVLGSMHGYYERAGEQVTRAIRTLPIPRGLHLWVIDTMNPDGDARHQRGNAHGVDLNRNWPNAWRYIPWSADTFDSHYSGPKALSEPETRVMLAFLQSVRPQRMVSLHQPLHGVDTTDGGAKDPAFRNALASRLGLPLQAFTCFGDCHGNMTGWLTNHSATIGITVEFASAPSSAYLTGRAARGILSALMVGRPVSAMSRTAAATFVGAVGQALLGRRIGEPWTTAVAAGTKSKAQVATAIATSTERRNRLTVALFAACLGRAPTSAELASRAAYLATGSWEYAVALACGGAEAARHAAGNWRLWATRLGYGVLGAAPTASAVTQWAGSVTAGTAPFVVARRAASSAVGQRGELDRLYRIMLGRAADSAAVTADGPAMPGRGLFSVPARLAASPEFARVHGF